MLGTVILPVKPCFLPLHQSLRRQMFVRASVASVAHPSAAPDRRCLYEVLRVRRNASPVEIKTAYRTLAKLYHPDATSRFLDSSAAAAGAASSDGGDFIEIHNAYATLSDPDARAAYDFNLNVNSQRRFSTAGYRSPGRGRFQSTRRWETDQCW